MRIFNVAQHSAEWHSLRLGRPTASKFNKIILPNGKRSGQARNYLYALCWERLTSRSTDPDIAEIPTVKFGRLHEDEAADKLAAEMGVKLNRIGICLSDDGRIGASPDRVVDGRNEGVEIKCPTGPVLIGSILDGPDNYLPQIAGQQLVCNFSAVHLFCYRPDAPAYRYTFTATAIASYVRDLNKYLEEFCNALDEAYGRLAAMQGWKDVLGADWPDDTGEDEAA
jgi:hypothetical protein